MTRRSRPPATHNNKEIKQFLKRQQTTSSRYLYFSIIVGTINGAFLIGQAWIFSSLVTQAVFHNLPLMELQHLLWLLLSIFVIRAILTWCAEFFAFSAAACVKRDLRRSLLDRIYELLPQKKITNETGVLITTWLDNVDAMHDYYARYIPAMALTVLVPLSILIFIFPIDWRSALIMALTAPLIPTFMILIGKSTEDLSQRQWRKLSYLSGYFLDLIQGMTTLKLFNASKREAKIVRAISEDYRFETMKVLKIAFLSSLTLEFFSTISIAIIAVTIGFRLMWGQLDYKYGFFVLLLAPEFYLPLRRMGVHYHARLQAIGAAENLMPFMADLHESQKSEQNQILLNFAPHIVFEDVTYGYEGQPSLLDKINFEILPSLTTGLIGETGAGKSTIMALILGFIRPISGRITIDGIDINNIDMNSYRKNIGWVTQYPKLLPATIKENILLGNPELTEKQFSKLCDRLDITSFAMNRSEKFDTIVGENGLGLSGGQTQRIALARALARNSGLLLLDEPTSHLDNDTEEIIDKTLMVMGQGKTRFIITHRDIQLQNLDIVYQLKDRKVTKLVVQ